MQPLRTACKGTSYDVPECTLNDVQLYLRANLRATTVYDVDRTTLLCIVRQGIRRGNDRIELSIAESCLATCLSLLLVPSIGPLGYLASCYSTLSLPGPSAPKLG